MSPHRVVTEAGPGAIRDCVVAQTWSASAAALAAIDDRRTNGLPWIRQVRRVLTGGRRSPWDGLKTVAHGGSSAVTAAARTLTSMSSHPRSWLLRRPRGFWP